MPKLGRSRSNPDLAQEKQLVEHLDPDDVIHAATGHPKPRRSRSLEHIQPDSAYYEFREPDHGCSPHALYKEALYTGLHALGRPTERCVCNNEEICMYAHLAFKESQNEQKAVVDHVLGEPFPVVIINAMVRKAEGLPSDANPYCLVGLNTQESASKQNWQPITLTAPDGKGKGTTIKHKRLKEPEKRLNQNYAELPALVRTSIHYQTSSPVWDERFQCLSFRPSVDKFTVEVWEHNDDKSTLHALKHAKNAKKANIVKRGTKNLEDAFYRGKRDNFLGKVTVRIQDIPCDGSEVRYNLHGVTHRGVGATGWVLLQISMTHAFRHGRHFQEYEEPRLILTCLWDHILNVESRKYERASGASHWDGKIPAAAKCLLFQYALQAGISETTQGSIQWKAYLKHSLDLGGLATSLAHLQSTVKASDEKLQEWKVSELEATLLGIIIERVCPILRNHLLGETQERVHFAVNTIRDCIAVLKRFGLADTIHAINLFVTTYIRLCVLDWYEAKFYAIVTTQMTNVQMDYELVNLYAAMIRRVNGFLNEGVSIWSLMFWMEGFIDYMPIMYGELQKMIVFDVEDISWRLTWRTYDTNDKLRRTLLGLDDGDKKFCAYMFDLYHETQLFVLRADEIPSLEDKRFHILRDYHCWFRPMLCLWLGFAFIKSCQMMASAISIDTIVAQTEYVKNSSSALDTHIVFLELAAFWTKLNWPEMSENFVIVHFLMEVLAHDGILYSNLKWKKIEREGYFDTIDQFDVSKRLCIALNNMATVKTAMINSFHAFKLNSLMEKMEDDGVGEAEAAKHQKLLQDLMLYATDQIDVRVGRIMDGIKIRIKPEIRDNIEDYLIHLSRDPTTHDMDTALDNLLGYLEDNLVVLDKQLLEKIFVPVLQVFWKAFCEELVECVRHFPLNEGIFAQKEFFHQIADMVQVMLKYFRGGLDEQEINCEEYIRLEQFIELFQWDTDALIGLYFHEKAEEQFFPHPPTYGTLQARASYWNGTLNVEVISGRNLVGADPVVSNYWQFWKWKSKAKATSDCMVQLDLVPEVLFMHPQKQETTIKRSTKNPDYGEPFSWLVTIEECRHPNAVLRFTVKDFDLLSKNDFIGEAFIPLGALPGVKAADRSVIQQPMNLFLRSNDGNNSTNNIMQILKCRRWEKQAKQFVADEEGREVKIPEP